MTLLLHWLDTLLGLTCPIYRDWYRALDVQMSPFHTFALSIMPGRY